MFHRHLSSWQRRSRQSSALVITLAVLVLVSALLLVFFNQSTLNRQISFSSAGQYRADLAAHTALDTIVGDLRSEIAAGSTIYTSNSISIYIPKNNFTVVPSRVGDQGFPNLVKQSASTSNSWTGTYYDTSVLNPKRSAANNSTASPSQNGRYVGTNQWNKPGLLGDPGLETTPTVPAAYVAPPDWVLITRQGAVPDATVAPFKPVDMSTLSKSSAGNQMYVVGRYAYTIYDEGGLLDVNVAGFPSSLTGSTFTSKRGLLPQVDLANIPGIDTAANANALVQWRNQTTASSPTSYTNYVFNETNGFTAVATGDEAFVGRRDLIKYVQAKASATPSQISTSALQYLGTFTRELNAPSYTPPALNSAMRPKTQEGSEVGQDDQFNPSLINTRVSVPFIKARTSDGTFPVVGEPLIKYRFPLSRLNWIGYNGPAPGITALQIQDSFGLQWAPSPLATNPGNVWIYVGHADDLNPSTIPNLPQVAAAGREPDFFELLQAGILLGSLGKSIVPFYSNTSVNDKKTSYQVIQIGANLIDQYDSDSYPTRISFDGTEFDGIEDLPYITRVFETAYRLHGAGQPTGNPNFGVWYQPEIFNPHSQVVPAGLAPTQFRFISVGYVFVKVFSDQPSPPLQVFSTPINQLSDSPPNSGYGITFSTVANTFSSPTLLTPSNSNSGDSNNVVSDAGNNFLGIWAGTAQIFTAGAEDQYDWVEALPGPLISHLLQYQSGTQWITYLQMKNLKIPIGTFNVDTPRFEKYQQAVYELHSDPRTDRFGVTASSDIYSLVSTIRKDAGNGAQQVVTPSPGWANTGPQIQPGQLSGYLGCLTDNLTSSVTHYADPDQVQRPADGAYTDGNVSHGGYPLAIDTLNNPSSRPLILNRQFRSVAEMGYAFRDEPWKHLDFFTATSGDAALLDLFCLTDESPKPPVAEAGCLNLNTRQLPVLQAVLAGAIKSDEDGTVINPGISNEAGTLAASLISLTAPENLGPLLNRSELVTRWSPILTYASIQDTIIKRRHEAAIRALSDVGNTRTWNLLIDVIAQSGRYSPNATNLNQFVVEGERRYWLHVAVDRYTGKIVSQSLEPVYE